LTSTFERWSEPRLNELDQPERIFRAIEKCDEPRVLCARTRNADTPLRLKCNS
jgi:hypothetical protein